MSWNKNISWQKQSKIICHRKLWCLLGRGRGKRLSRLRRAYGRVVDLFISLKRTPSILTPVPYRPFPRRVKLPRRTDLCVCVCVGGVICIFVFFFGKRVGFARRRRLRSVTTRVIFNEKKQILSRAVFSQACWSTLYRSRWPLASRRPRPSS